MARRVVFAEPGEASDGDGILKYSASLVTQNSYKFYTLTMPISVLSTTTFVTSRYEDPKEGFQRSLDEKRAIEISKYVDSGLGTIPQAIILSAQTDAELVFVSGKTLQFKNIPKAFLIIDGQHRVYGFSMATSKLRVPVVIYNSLSRKDETRLFIDINTKQKPVPAELLLDIKKLAEYESDHEVVYRDVFDSLSDDVDSPLLGLMSPNERVSGKITRVTFKDAIKNVYSKFKGYDTIEFSAFVKAYLHAVIASSEIVNELISQPTIFKAIMELMIDVSARVKDRYGKIYSVDNYSDVVQPVFSDISAATLRRSGRSNKQLYEILKKILNQNVDF